MDADTSPTPPSTETRAPEPPVKPPPSDEPIAPRIPSELAGDGDTGSVLGASDARTRVAGEDYPDNETPHTYGFIQPGFYYRNELMETPEYIYVARIHGDGGIDGHFGKHNYIDAISVGPTSSQDRPFMQTRGAMRGWATHRLSREEMPERIPASRELRRAREYEAQKAAYIQEQPNPDYSPSERPK